VTDEDWLRHVKYAALSYADSRNLGDNIQTLAVEQYLPRVDRKIDREALAEFSADRPHLIILNGWFSQHPEKVLPPSDSIVPIFIGFHIAESGAAASHFLKEPSLAAFRCHQPIGCRDDRTRRLLQDAGIDAYTSFCLTLTFPTRSRTPKDGRVFIVDGDWLPVPPALRKGAVRFSHEIPDELGDDVKTALARRTLEVYRDCARLVITSRLHCALPCLAMGIPVVFFGDAHDSRIRFVQDLGLKIHPIPRETFLVRLVRITPVLRRAWNWWRSRRIDWAPRRVNIDEVKETLSSTTTEAIANAEAKPRRSEE
jgi:hypothetical protein